MWGEGFKNNSVQLTKKEEQYKETKVYVHK